MLDNHLTFREITVRYGKKTVLDGVTLDIPRGSFVTVIGRNGCGKSTLLSTVFGAVKPQSGSVVYEGKNIGECKNKELARGIAYLAQTHTAPPDTDVYTLVSYGRYPHTRFGGSLTAADRTVIDETLEMTGLNALCDRRIDTLSGGELQRAWIAMTICRRPKVLMLDEPTTYLDIGCQLEVLELLKRLQRELSVTVLAVLHDLNLAAKYSDRLAVLDSGRISAYGSPDETMTEAVLRDAFGVGGEIRYDEVDGCPYFIPHGKVKNNEN